MVDPWTWPSVGGVDSGKCCTSCGTLLVTEKLRCQGLQPLNGATIRGREEMPSECCHLLTLHWLGNHYIGNFLYCLNAVCASACTASCRYNDQYWRDKCLCRRVCLNDGHEISRESISSLNNIVHYLTKTACLTQRQESISAVISTHRDNLFRQAFVMPIMVTLKLGYRIVYKTRKTLFSKME